MRSAYWKTNVFFFLPQSYIFQRHARELQLFSLVYELLYATFFAFHLDMQEIFFPLYTYFSLALVVMSLLFFIHSEILHPFLWALKHFSPSFKTGHTLSCFIFEKRSLLEHLLEILLSFFLSLTFSHWLWLSSCRCFDSLAYLLKEWLSTCVALLFICCFYGSLLPWSFDRLTC